jgi:opacity protein-like surface antigen
MRALAYLFVTAALALATACASFAAEPLQQGKIAAPQQPWTPLAASAPIGDGTWKVHNWYVGAVGGYAWAPEQAEDTWQGGVVGGYLWRSGLLGLGLGVEADYVVRDLGHFTIDDAVASIRGRAGMFMAGGTFVYATAGVAEAMEAAAPDGARKGLVVGGGIEWEALKGLALRGEVLHYRHADGYFEWGDEGSTAVRLGALVKF